MPVKISDFTGERVEYDEYPVTDYDLGFVGMTLNFTLRDGVDTITEDTMYGLPVLVLTIHSAQFEAPQRNVFFLNHLLGVRSQSRIQRTAKVPKK